MEPSGITPRGFNQGRGVGFGLGKAGERAYDLGHEWLSGESGTVQEESQKAYPRTSFLDEELDKLGMDGFDDLPDDEGLGMRSFHESFRRGGFETPDEYEEGLALDGDEARQKIEETIDVDEDAQYATGRAASLEELTADMFGRSNNAKALNAAWNVDIARGVAKTATMRAPLDNSSPSVLDEDAESFISRLRKESRGNVELRSQHVIAPDSELGDDLRQMFHCVKTATTSIAPGDYTECPVFGRKFRGRCMPFTGLSFEVLDEMDERQKAKLKLWQEVQNAIRASSASQSSGARPVDEIAPEHSLFAIVHHCCLASEVGALDDKNLAKLGEAVQRAKTDPGVLRPYHWLLQTKLGNRRTMCHHLLNSLCKLAGRASAPSSAEAMVWLVRGLLSAEHSLSYDECMTFEEMQQKGLVPQGSGMDRDAIHFATRMWDAGMSFPIMGKNSTPMFISTWRNMLESNRSRTIASFKALDDTLKNSSMVSLLARAYECRRQDIEDALQMLRALVLKMPSNNPEKQALSVMLSKISETRFLNQVFGVGRSLAETLRATENKKIADQRTGITATRGFGSLTDASMWMLSQTQSQMGLPSLNLAVGDAQSSLRLPAHVIGSSKQSTSIGGGNTKADVGCAGPMTSVELAAMLAEYPPLSHVQQETGYTMMEESKPAPMTIEEISAKMNTITESHSGAIFRDKEGDVVATAKEVMETMGLQKDGDLPEVEQGQVILGVVEDHIKAHLSERVLETLGVVMNNLEKMKEFAAKVVDLHSGFVTAGEAQKMAQRPEELIEKVALEEEKKQELIKIMETGQMEKPEWNQLFQELLRSGGDLKVLSGNIQKVIEAGIRSQQPPQQFTKTALPLLATTMSKTLVSDFLKECAKSGGQLGSEELVVFNQPLAQMMVAKEISDQTQEIVQSAGEKARNLIEEQFKVLEKQGAVLGNVQMGLKLLERRMGSSDLAALGFLVAVPTLWNMVKLDKHMPSVTVDKVLDSLCHFLVAPPPAVVRSSVSGQLLHHFKQGLLENVEKMKETVRKCVKENKEMFLAVNTIGKPDAKLNVTEVEEYSKKVASRTNAEMNKEEKIAQLKKEADQMLQQEENRLQLKMEMGMPKEQAQMEKEVLRRESGSQLKRKIDQIENLQEPTFKRGHGRVMF